VFLADIFRQELNRGNDYAYSWSHNMHGLKAGPYIDANLAFLELQALWHGKSEEARIFYVALTRAKEKLFILGNNEETKKTAARHLSNAGLWPQKLAAFCDEPPALSSAAEIVFTPYIEPKEFIYLTAGGSPRENILDGAQWAKIWRKRNKNYEKIKEERLFISPSSLAAHSGGGEGSVTAFTLGDLCHKVLELWDFKARIDGDLIGRAAEFLKVADGEIKKEAAEIFDNFNNSPLFKQLTAMEVLAKEMPFTLSENGKIISGIMDAVVRNNGKILILDYKTDKMPAAAKYAPQLAAYKRAAQTIFKEEIETGIIFLRQSELEVLC
jgi:ATP-dependent helicase/nuclease subunit A